MKIYKCSTEVIIKNIEIVGYITAVIIRFNNVTYEISYFLNNIYYQSWFNEIEFELKNKVEKINIGFT